MMARCCNGLDSRNRAVSKIDKLRLRANRTTWENVTDKSHDLSQNAPFTTHFRDILLDGIKAAENLNMDEGATAGAENLFPNTWTQNLQTIEERFARMNMTKTRENN
ncbi:Oidioi.mRNA.OKI2018_I69.chr1.g3863.t1.cds [Oikopleura dioica]|uniref:Oidioi.mRNA.OKI2018_I69.PAR.g10648.t1.cds n=1 Tax=Oikopleura dioica TaxID=34765 RepID=A0ABN7RRQ1_OIKDI|nr:Oidioi.mRNA.OKI2018_I69.PAR.g10648.t1.cds [Oikopleura dioica]CAG5108581.1 Oidioi.mRNA.OKI2018_I69.chr1.g3863.t1.cds [Oikopleura dioica]